jgi:peptide deformylase
MKLSIIHYPHPTLRYKSKPIRRVDQQLRAMADQMLELMYEAKGVGLAANQVDLPIRMFVANPAGIRGEGEELVLLNPEFQLPKGSETAQEGCLSLPGLYGNVKRPKSIRINAFDIKGNAINRTVDGFLARVLQHENDHLNGVLFFDRMSEESTRELEDRLDEMETDFRSKQKAGSIQPDERLVARLSEWTDRYA